MRECMFYITWMIIAGTVLLFMFLTIGIELGKSICGG